MSTLSVALVESRCDCNLEDGSAGKAGSSCSLREVGEILKVCYIVKSTVFGISGHIVKELFFFFLKVIRNMSMDVITLFDNIICDDSNLKKNEFA